MEGEEEEEGGEGREGGGRREGRGRWREVEGGGRGGRGGEGKVEGSGGRRERGRVVSGLQLRWFLSPHASVVELQVTKASAPAKKQQVSRSPLSNTTCM